MKNFIILVAFILATTQAVAAKPLSEIMKQLLEQTKNEVSEDDLGDYFYIVSDPKFEWSQNDSKKIKAEIKSEGLVLESKEGDGIAFSIVDVPMAIDDEAGFIFGFDMKGDKVDDSKSFGIIFDYQDSRNYKGISISKKQYSYFVVQDGTKSDVKTGLVKYNGRNYRLIMERENGGIEVYLNGIEVCKIKRVAIANPSFGAFVKGKMKGVVPDFVLAVAEPEDSEESTTGM